MTTWRGLSVGDVYVVACFPDHPETIDAIEVHPSRMAAPELRAIFPEPTIEWATVWGIKDDKWQTRGETKLHIDSTGNPVWRLYEDRPRERNGVYRWWYDEIPIVIVEHTFRPLVQLSMFGDAA